MSGQHIDQSLEIIPHQPGALVPTGVGEKAVRSPDQACAAVGCDLEDIRRAVDHCIVDHEHEAIITAVVVLPCAVRHPIAVVVDVTPYHSAVCPLDGQHQICNAIAIEVQGLED
jgi:hypothetical protein